MTITADVLEALSGDGPDHLRPAIATLRRGGCSLWSIPPAGDILRMDQGGPLIMLIHDGGPGSGGPAAFRTARFMADQVRPRVARCATALVTSVPFEGAYANVAERSAVERGNAVIVETTIEHERAWAESLISAQPEIALFIAHAEGDCA